jgi:hypothetical protein
MSRSHASSYDPFLNSTECTPFSHIVCVANVRIVRHGETILCRASPRAPVYTARNGTNAMVASNNASMRRTLEGSFITHELIHGCASRSAAVFVCKRARLNKCTLAAIVSDVMLSF